MWLWCETFELFCIFFIVGTTPNVFRLILSQMSPSIYTDWDRPIVRNVRTIRKTETIFPHKNIYIYDNFHAPSKKSSNCNKFYETIENMNFCQKFICDDTQNIFRFWCECADGCVENVFLAIHIITVWLTYSWRDDAVELVNWINFTWTVGKIDEYSSTSVQIWT